MIYIEFKIVLLLLFVGIAQGIIRVHIYLGKVIEKTKKPEEENGYSPPRITCFAQYGPNYIMRHLLGWPLIYLLPGALMILVLFFPASWILFLQSYDWKYWIFFLILFILYSIALKRKNMILKKFGRCWLYFYLFTAPPSLLLVLFFFLPPWRLTVWG